MTTSVATEEASTPLAASGTPIDALLQETRQEIVRTDTKASVLFALLGVLMAAIAALCVRNPMPAQLRWIVGSAVALSMVSALLLLGAVRPRLGVGGLGRQEYFAHFARYAKRAGDLERELLRSPAELSLRKVAQLVDLSCLVLRKYRLIQIAVDLFLVSVAMAGIGALLTLWGVENL